MKSDLVAAAHLAYNDGRSQPVGVAYAPGNGSEYQLMFTPVRALIDEHNRRFPRHRDRATSAFGASDGWIITVINLGGRAMVLSGNGTCVHWTYVAEKLRLPTPDAKALAELFEAVGLLGSGLTPVGTPDDPAWVPATGAEQ